MYSHFYFPCWPGRFPDGIHFYIPVVPGALCERVRHFTLPEALVCQYPFWVSPQLSRGEARPVVVLLEVFVLPRTSTQISLAPRPFFIQHPDHFISKVNAGAQMRKLRHFQTPKGPGGGWALGRGGPEWPCGPPWATSSLYTQEEILLPNWRWRGNPTAVNLVFQEHRKGCGWEEGEAPLWFWLQARLTVGGPHPEPLPLHQLS